MSQNTYIKDFKNLTKSNVSEAGGKGASLGEMTQAGIPVPPGFVILASAFEKFLDETDLNAEIDTILHTVNHKKIHTVEKASEEIQAMILHENMPKDLGQEILASFKKLNTKYVAVRSSATAEDSSSDAWAGQLDTFLNTTEKELLENVKRCWASLFTPRAIFYRFEKKLHKKIISVAVVVQKMVQSEVSGIAFSVHPVTEDRNQLIIEAGFGLGEAVVSGQITPDSYVLEKNPFRIIDENVSEQSRQLIKARVGNEWVDLNLSQGSKQKLSDQNIKILAKLILRIEKHYGFPVDIEWAREKNKFYITQARPITTLMKEEQQQEKKVVPRIKAFKNKLQCIFDRNDIYPWPWMFADEVVTSDISKVTGGKLALIVEEYKEGYLYHYVSFDEIDKFGENTLKKLLKNEDYFEKVLTRVYQLSSELKKFGDELRERDYKKYTDQELVNTIRDYVNLLKKVRAWGWIPPLVDGMKTPFLSNQALDHLQRELKGVTKSELNEIYSLLSTPDNFGEVQKSELEKFALIKFLGPAEFTKFRRAANGKAGLGKLKKDSQEKISDYVKKFAWLTYNYEGPQFDLEILHKQIKGLDYAKAMKEWAGVLAHQKETNERKRVLANRNSLSKRALHTLRVAREFAQLKEYRKSIYQHSYVAAEKPLRELAARINLTFLQVRYLSLEEMLDALMNGKDYGDVAEKRTKYCVIVIKDGESFYLQDNEARDAVSFYKKPEKQVEKVSFKGQVAYPGKVQGKAKIVLTARDLVKMKKGDVLVSSSTNPDLLMGMKKAGAIVTDLGGVTSHAAIVSRELKIPCVIGTKDITKHVHDGDSVEVDANMGIVKILK